MMDPEHHDAGKAIETEAQDDAPVKTGSSGGDVRAEEKRRAARRRFLVGAAAISAIATVGPRQAHAAGKSVCMSLGYPKDDKGKKYGSFYCATGGGGGGGGYNY